MTGFRWAPGGCICCDPCPSIHVSLSTDGSNFAPEWECDDLDNITVHGVDDVTVTDDTIAVIQSLLANDSATATEPIAETAIATTGSGTYNGNRTIKFANHATEYTVVRHVTNTMTITPGLTAEVPSTTVISDVSPTTSFPNVDAYYVRLQFRATTGIVDIHQGTGGALTNTAIDIDAQTITHNAETAEDLPYPQDSQWHVANHYVCPTHSMGEASVRFSNAQVGIPVEYSSHPSGFYGASVVDDADPTVNNTWSVEGTEAVRLKQITYYPAHVTVSDVYDDGYVLTTDCGRFDLFPCPWMLWKDLDTTPSMVVTGWDEPLDDGFGTTWGDYLAWRFNSSPSTTIPGPPPPADNHSYIGCWFYSYRQHVLEQTTNNYLISWRGGDVANAAGLYFQAGAFYTRDAPTHSVPYPLPYAQVQLSYRDFRAGLNDECADEVLALLDLADAAAMGGTWTLAATLSGDNCTEPTFLPRTSDTTLTWTRS